MNIALILSGGTGTRLRSKIPKQYIQVGDRPVIAYCIECLSLHEGIDAIQIVADMPWRRHIAGILDQADRKKKFQGFSKPGKNRQLSIYHGLEDVKKFADDSDYILIHDAARPLLSGTMITDCLAASAGHDGVMPALPMKDTVYSSADGNRITSLLKRNEIYAGQAPEVFHLGVYYEANKKLFPDKILNINGSAEPAVMAGLDIVMIPGDEGNFKITTEEDLERFRLLVGAAEERETSLKEY